MSDRVECGTDPVLLAWIDDRADEFEAAWRGVQPPNLADFLGDVSGAQRLALLAELVKLDRAYRQHLGEKRRLGDYLHAFPELADVEPFRTEARTTEETLAPETAPPAAAPGVQGFEILDELGRGGMGVVYRARQGGLNRTVAVKMLLAGGDHRPQVRARFRAEAETAARLQHPHIVQIHEVGEQDGRPYCVMEYVAGGTLAARLAGTPQPPELAARLTETLARAVAYAHQHGVVHRDLKPANVLIADCGLRIADSEEQSAIRNLQSAILKIADFGLAKRLFAPLAEEPHTASGEILGTPSYMAPEQAEGKASTLDARTDVYGLGTILYEMLTGRPPFRGESTLDTLEQVRSQEPLPPSQLRPGLPRDLGTICLKALAKVPARRYASAQELADDLRRFLEGQSILARPVGRLEKGWRWCRRNPAVATLTTAVVLSLLIGIGLSSYFAVQAEQRKDAAVASATLARQEKRTADRRRYLSDMRLAQRAWDDTQIPWFLELLNAQRPTGTDEDHRSFEWHYWHRRFHSARRVLRGHDGPVRRLAFQSGRLVSVGGDRTLRIWNPDNGQQVAVHRSAELGDVPTAFSASGRLAAPASVGLVKVWEVSGVAAPRPLWSTKVGGHDLVLSGDGRCLACIDGQKIRLHDGATGTELQSVRTPGIEAHCLALCPAGRQLAAAVYKEGKVRIWNLATPTTPLDVGEHGGVVHSMAFSPDAKLLATSGYDRIIHLWDVVGGKELTTFRGHKHSVMALAFSADGKRLISASNDRTVRIWDWAGNGAPLVLTGSEQPVVALAVADGWLAGGSADGRVYLWDQTSGQAVRSLIGHRLPVYGVAFSPEGRQLATSSGPVGNAATQAGGEITVWDVEQGQPVLELPRQSQCVNDVRFSPDGRRLATAGDDNIVRVWEVPEGRQTLELRRHIKPVWATAFSPDGRHLASAGYDARVHVWELATGKLLRSFEGENALLSVAYRPDGRQLAASTATLKVHVWDAHSGTEAFTLLGHTEGVWSVVYSPDGRLLATGSNDGTVRLWDATAGRELRTLRGHLRRVFRLAFSPDGRRLASAGDDGVKLWDVVDGRETLSLTDHAAAVFGVAFSPAGTLLATGGWDRSVRLWDARP